MKLVHNLADLPDELRGQLQRGAVSVGNFDGVHLGHARIIETLVKAAERVEGPAIVLTFDPHPARLLRPEQAPKPLTWIERKAELLAALGVDVTIAYPTDEALLRLSAREFFDEILRRRLDVRAMVEGPNFRFGRDRQGTIETLQGFTTEAGNELEVVDALRQGGDYISSSRLRSLIAEGDVQSAGRMMTAPYRIRGTVSRGMGRGAKIGFPTANLEDIDTLLPGEGVYAGAAYRGGDRWPAAINLGSNPTFDETTKKVEVHLIGFDEPLYGEALEVEFLSRLRDIRPFEDVEALKKQLAEDVKQAMNIAVKA